MLDRLERMALSHLRLQLDRLTVDDEPAVSVMVDGLGVVLRRVRPGFQHLDDKEVVSVDKAGVGYLAFEIGKTFGHERRRYALRRRGRQSERDKFVDVAARAVADIHDFGRQFQRRDGDDAFTGCPQRGKAVIGAADDTTDQWRLKLDHHMPGHRHDVGAAMAGGRQEDHRSRFE